MKDDFILQSFRLFSFILKFQNMQKLVFLFLLSCFIRFSTSQSCSCVSSVCNCAGQQSCPFSTRIATFSNLECNGCTLDIKVETTDGSTFAVYSMNNVEYAKYQNGQSFITYPDYSNDTAGLFCFNAPPAQIIHDAEIFVVFQCTNAVQNCPYRYSVQRPTTNQNSEGISLRPMILFTVLAFVLL